MLAMNKRRILVTGGAGYIGSHTVKKLLKSGYDVFVIDDLSTGNETLLMTEKFQRVDIADASEVQRILNSFKPDAVIHFAASKDAPESMSDPEKYYKNNVVKSIQFFSILKEFGVKKIIFSSTAAVYGDVHEFPITEDFQTKPTNPYGFTKLVLENILLDYQKAYGFEPLIFRYFNAGGADMEGGLGNLYPNPKDVISVITKVANGKAAKFEILGTDYDTRDGSCIRDIIHVDDLAEAHVLGLKALLEQGKTGVYNLGSQQGYSIREIVEATKKITESNFEVIESDRRAGDIVVSIASSEKANKELGWFSKYTLADIISSAWNWERMK